MFFVTIYFKEGLLGLAFLGLGGGVALIAGAIAAGVMAARRQ